MNRLLKIASLIDINSKVVDIGSDHLKLPIYLYDNNITKSITATEYNNEPFNNSINNRGLRDINVLLKDGLIGLNEDFDIAIIAGMGGFLIKKIIYDSINKFKKMDKVIIQPMTAIKEIREFMFKEGFLLIEEYIVRDLNKFYEILVYKEGEDLEYDFTFLKYFSKDDEAKKEYLYYRIERLKEIYKKIPKNNSKRNHIYGRIKVLRKLSCVIA